MPGRADRLAALTTAARDWPSYRLIQATLLALADDETLLIQSGRPVGVFPSHADAPRVLVANSNLVGRLATPEQFYRLSSPLGQIPTRCKHPDTVSEFWLPRRVTAGVP